MGKDGKADKKPRRCRGDRAKHAKTIISKTIPAMLKSDPRARRGVESAVLIADPPEAPGDADGDGDGDGDGKGKGKSGGRGDGGGAKITLSVADALAAAHRLHLGPGRPPPSASTCSPRPGRGGNGRGNLGGRGRESRVAVLNMASPLRPGGGILTGATSQEESLCSRTTLYPSLREEWYRLPELGGVFTRDVLVFSTACDNGAGCGPGVGAGGDTKGGKSAGDEDGEAKGRELGKEDWFFVDVVTAAMVRFPDVVEKPTGGTGGEEEAEQVYAEEKDREMAVSKMRAVMRILKSKAVDKVVLGAWGCGAYGNPVGEVARAWRKVLLGNGKDTRGRVKGREGWDGLEVVFAINDGKMAERFAQCFGEGLVVGLGHESRS
ncbi:uncharacterized protein MKZ38_005142 [Zalerion maritima]|uniref:Microbial-type PARG catalytic domain-containing protein n=1 Tax=Zalerion maritima TaxID=339359 RepID=A0AAD5RKI0_9PEZI|nr:uncharacterized protein MKZ38_005142 [Zalerion maritima]